MPKNILIEACVASVESALAAQQGGAKRIELCDNLVEGGTTPSAGLIELTRRHCNLAMHVLIRPRGGDFYYSPIEFDVMRRDVLLAKQSHADGVVIGILNLDGSIDLERTKELVDLSHPLSVTFHRAFDMVNDPSRSLEELFDIGVDRILTSGCKNSALEGVETIAGLVKKANGYIAVMAGGGVNKTNAKTIIEKSGVKEIHVGGTSVISSPMQYRNETVRIGRPFTPQEYAHFQTDPEKIKALVESLL